MTIPLKNRYTGLSRHQTLRYMLFQRRHKGIQLLLRGVDLHGEPGNLVIVPGDHRHLNLIGVAQNLTQLAHVRLIGQADGAELAKPFKALVDDSFPVDDCHLITNTPVSQGLRESSR